jgi:hypothetical protein
LDVPLKAAKQVSTILAVSRREVFTSFMINIDPIAQPIVQDRKFQMKLTKCAQFAWSRLQGRSTLYGHLAVVKVYFIEPASWYAHYIYLQVFILKQSSRSNGF